jgi:hypothetical protein
MIYLQCLMMMSFKMKLLQRRSFFKIFSLMINIIKSKKEICQIDFSFVTINKKVELTLLRKFEIKQQNSIYVHFYETFEKTYQGSRKCFKNFVRIDVIQKGF